MRACPPRAWSVPPPVMIPWTPGDGDCMRGIGLGGLRSPNMCPRNVMFKHERGQTPSGTNGHPSHQQPCTTIKIGSDGRCCQVTGSLPSPIQPHQRSIPRFVEKTEGAWALDMWTHKRRPQTTSCEPMQGRLNPLAIRPAQQVTYPRKLCLTLTLPPLPGRAPGPPKVMILAPPPGY